MRAPLVAALSLLLGSTAAAGQEPLHAHDGSGHRLGTVVFPNSGSPAAQAPFLRGVALIHSFEYTDAAEAFREAQAADPAFALAYWGEALTHTQLLWGVDDAQAAREALARFAPTAAERLARAGSVRERAYGAAVEAFYAEAEATTRARAFADSLRALATREPDDLEAAAFASLAIQMALAAGAFPGDAGGDARAEAAALAERVFRASPEHPGAAHYLIHAYDDPVLAPRGLEAARAYASIAPDAEHALHMPSHIFVQVGAWPDAVASNERAWAASRAWVERRGESPTELDFHSLEWLQYAYLQEGRIGMAAALVDTARSVLQGVDPAGAYADARFVVPRLEFALAAHTGDWEAWRPADVPEAVTPASARERSFLRTAAYQAAAGRALADDPAAAEAVSAPLREQASGPTGGAGGFLALQLDALASGARGERDSMLEGLERAAVAEEALPPVGPPSYLPTHELLGSALLEADRPVEAAAAFERALERRPNRSRALLGLARALEGSGDHAGSAATYRRLLTNWREADPALPELEEARTGAGATSGSRSAPSSAP